MTGNSKTQCLIVALMALAACAGTVGEPRTASEAMQADGSNKAAVTQLTNPRPTRILFVGNSYFYYNDSLHNHVQRMAVAANVVRASEVTYKSATIGGAALRDHAIDHLLDPSNLRVEAKFEAVVMQGISSAALSENSRKRFTETAIAYAGKVRAAGGEPVLYMIPAYVPPHRQSRADMIDDIASLYIETGNRIGALVIPVGLAFDEAYRRRPDIELHKSFDGSHPSLLGTYLAAATTFAAIYQTSPIGNSYDYFGTVSSEDAEFLQQVAHDTVAKFHRVEF